jgi:hypothetical protein|tara:strand:- start:1240 stop:1548 length:309 start_codon:yes stop_codon:yes gene_type:complete
MAANEIHVNDVGTTFQLTFQDDGSVVDVSSASAVEVLLMGPDDTATTKTATLVSDGTDGKVKYVTVSGDIETAGTWKIQGKVTFASSVYNSDVHTFTVYKNL